MRWKKMGHLLGVIDLQPGTKHCLENVLKDQLDGFLCAKDREETFNKLLDFVVRHVEITLEDWKVDQSWIKLLHDFAEIIKTLMVTVLQEIVGPQCPIGKLSPNIRSSRSRRQFGVKDMLQTLKNIFCDPTVIKGYGEELQRRHNNTFTAWAIEAFGEAWCCLVDGEWDEILIT